MDLLTVVPGGDWARIIFVFCHVIFCAFAVTTVLKADYKILSSDLSPEDVAKDAKLISKLLAGLWVSGLAIIYVDTGFSPDIVMLKAKLVLKLACVFLLTANGVILHHVSLPVLTRLNQKVSHSELVLLSVTGALSTSHWLLAAFIGLFTPLGNLPVNTLLQAYGLLISGILFLSLTLVPVINHIKSKEMARIKKDNLVSKCRLMIELERSQ